MSFSTEKATQKFQQLNETQQSIQSTSQWCLFHYRHCKELVSIWQQFFIKTLDPQKRLVLFYLCNDLVQFSKKKESKYSGFLTEFNVVLPNILRTVSADNKYPKILISKYLRVLSVWKERIIFSPNFIDKLKLSLENIPVKSIPSKSASNSTNSFTNNNNNNNIKIPTEISTLVNTYIKLNNLNSLYRSQYEIFQKRNELSKKNTQNVNRDELTKLEKLCNLLILQSNEISKLRSESLAELKKLIGVVEDWVQLDSGKAENLKSSLTDITARKIELEKNVLKEVVAQAQVQAQAQAQAEAAIQSEVQSVLNEREQDAPAYEVGESDEENEENNGMLQYINSDEEEDDDIPKYDEDEDEVDEDEGGKEDEDKTSATSKVEVCQSLNTETTDDSSNLKKRLLGETKDDKVIKKGKSVKFSEEDNRTVIFDGRHSPETVGKEPEIQEEMEEEPEDIVEDIEDDIERALDDAFEIGETLQDNDALSSLLSRLS